MELGEEMNLLYEEPSPYLQPPTLAELIYVVAGANHNTSKASFTYTSHLLQRDARTRKLLTTPFSLPEKIRKEVKNQSTAEILEQHGIRWEPLCIIDKLGPVPRYDNLDYLSALKVELAPEITLERGYSDCKGLSLLAVAASRANGFPARLICHDRHMVSQSRGPFGWQSQDYSLPSPFCYTRFTQLEQEVKIPKEFDKYYEKILNE